MQKAKNSGLARLARWASGVACAVVLGLLPMAPAQAGSCLAGAQCDIDLANTNALGVSVILRVHIDNTGANTILTVSWISDNLLNNPIGIDQFGYQSDVLASVLPTGWGQADCDPPGQNTCNMDGFGGMLSEIDRPGGPDLLFSFTLAGLVTSFPANGNGAEFVAHIRYDGGCSAFVSDGIANSPTANTACIPDRQLPEPGTLLLLGIGIAGLGLARRSMA